MGIHIIKFRDDLAAGVTELKLETRDTLYNGTEYFKLLEGGIGDITVGNDSTSDFIYYPSNLTVRVHINGDPSFWQRIIDELSTSLVYSELTVNNQIIHRGFLDNKSVIGNVLERTIRFTILDQSTTLKQYSPGSNPFQYDLDSGYFMTDLLLDLVANSNLYEYPFMNEVKYLGSIQTKDIINSNEVIFNFSELGARARFYYNNQNNYKNLAELFKSIMINYNCIGYYGLDRKLYLVPRLYEGQTPYIISKFDLLKDPEYQLTIREIEGIKARLWTGAYPKTDMNNYSTVIYGTVNSSNESDKTRVEELFIDQPFGVFPPAPNNTTGFSGLLGFYNGQFYNLSIGNNARSKDLYGNYYPWQNLWNLVVTKVWDYFSVRRKRRTLTLELDGLWDKWNFDKYYKIPELIQVFRPIKIKYNLYKKRTEMILRQVN